MTFFEELGGEDALREIIDLFVDRIFDDIMIGFHFRAASRERIKEKEYEFAARHLGARIPYTGRPLQEAHAQHPILGGQFDRRLKILEEVLLEKEAPDAVRSHWLEHTRQLKGQVLQSGPGTCDQQLFRLQSGE